ncbi:PaaI family thioesterase [Phenylobacterium sp.]|uniref:PaaI family thioesterase n=1 Tax=Phenylobacterium sp. TaxID=1871053 RepID=UPI002731B9D6|nr:PaaI family thioesterase [Phenylobacterium sp.]MDP1599164.1 PaaI family thioesterase [Phenylobacterium sp.]MDP3591904.1 PaaI family thioesterase [Phenylobacterium sp.]
MADVFPELGDNPVPQLNAMQEGFLPGELGLEVLEARQGYLRSQVKVTKKHMAPNGFMHAASVIALLDSAAGYGCRISLPEGGAGFTTIELKSNFLGTAREGDTVLCEARLAHGGHMTQVWDAVATHQETGKTIALFRCTQMVLYPR